MLLEWELDDTLGMRRRVKGEWVRKDLSLASNCYHSNVSAKIQQQQHVLLHSTMRLFSFGPPLGLKSP